MARVCSLLAAATTVCELSEKSGMSAMRGIGIFPTDSEERAEMALIGNLV
jgi:hypothetical protein